MMSRPERHSNCLSLIPCHPGELCVPRQSSPDFEVDELYLRKDSVKEVYIIAYSVRKNA